MCTTCRSIRVRAYVHVDSGSQSRKVKAIYLSDDEKLDQAGLVGNSTLLVLHTHRVVGWLVWYLWFGFVFSGLRERSDLSAIPTTKTPPPSSFLDQSSHLMMAKYHHCFLVLLILSLTLSSTFSEEVIILIDSPKLVQIVAHRV